MSRPSHDLRSFVRCLEARGALQRIAAVVDTDLEIAAITARVSQARGPALWFEHPAAKGAPVLTNLFGSPARAALALGGEKTLAPLLRRLRGQLASSTGPAGTALQRLCPPAATVTEPAPWDAVSGDFDDLPALRSWPGDGGRYLTLPLVVTRDPETGAINWGLYRVQLRDRHTALIAWKPGSGGAQHHAAWRERGQTMPVAIVLGAPPALLWAASAPLPAQVDEAAFVGLLTGCPVALTRTGPSGLPVPVAAEVVIEGTIAPDETALEGPFGNHTGAYVAAAPAPLLRLTALRRRRDFVYPCTVVGPPPMEDCYLAALTARLLLPLVQQELPQVVDLAQPLEGIFHGCTLVAVHSAAPAAELCRSLRQTALLRKARMLVLFDAQTDVHNLSRAFWQTINRVLPERDLHAGAGTLDIDARRLPQVPLQEDPATEQLLNRRWSEYGLPESWFD